MGADQGYAGVPAGDYGVWEVREPPHLRGFYFGEGCDIIEVLATYTARPGNIKKEVVFCVLVCYNVGVVYVATSL